MKHFKFQKGSSVPDVAPGIVDAKPVGDGQKLELRKLDDSQNLHDSDSGLDTTSIGSQKNNKQPDEKSDEQLSPNTSPNVKQSDSGVTSDSSADAKTLQKPKKQFDSSTRRRRIPKLGLTIKQNPDLSFIRRKPPPRCISCDSDLCQRQPLVKTNGILFMKRREKELLDLEHRIYKSLWDCAFTRSDIVADWTDDLKDHQDFCGQEIRTSLRYQRKYYEKQRREMLKDIEDFEEESIDIDTGQTTVTPHTVTHNIIEDDLTIDSSLRRENSRRVSKMDFGERLKKMKSKVQSTMNRAKPSQETKSKIISPSSLEEEFLPPPTARPKVKTRPVREEDYEINFSGKLQSTVLRLHCENCVLKDKPSEFQSVLFVCQL